MCLLLFIHLGKYSFMCLLFSIHPGKYSFICLLFSIHPWNTASVVCYFPYTHGIQLHLFVIFHTPMEYSFIFHTHEEYNFICLLLFIHWGEYSFNLFVIFIHPGYYIFVCLLFFHTHKLIQLHYFVFYCPYTHVNTASLFCLLLSIHTC
jgi:hypothetical protein